MKSFEQFLDEKAGHPAYNTKANSPTRLMARGCPRPAGPAKPAYRSLAVKKTSPGFKFF